jgi:hypothetical protein
MARAFQRWPFVEGMWSASGPRFTGIGRGGFEGHQRRTQPEPENTDA